MLKETIFEATQQIRRDLGKDDWCVSVFKDNAGIVKFTEDYNVAFKVETHTIDRRQLNLMVGPIPESVE